MEWDEDEREAKYYSKLLGYNKRKSKNMPQVFKAEGLDCAFFLFENLIIWKNSVLL